MEVKKGNSVTLFMASQAEAAAQNCDSDFLFFVDKNNSLVKGVGAKNHFHRKVQFGEEGEKAIKTNPAKDRAEMQWKIIFHNYDQKI